MYKKIARISFVILIASLFTGCLGTYSSFKYSKKDETAQFYVSKEKAYEYKIEDVKYKDKLERCVMDAYTVQAQTLGSNLMIEHISLDTSCGWRGLPRSMFSGFVKSKIKSDTMELQDRTEVNEYEFSMFKTSNNCIVYLITISQMQDTTFIVDNTGNFYKDLLSKVKPDYKLKETESSCTVNYKSSLMDDTQLSNRYFGRSSGQFKK